jgi:hypothetical protein
MQEAKQATVRYQEQYAPSMHSSVLQGLGVSQCSP